jgi:nucleoside-diphosphate-sugar epimerase
LTSEAVLDAKRILITGGAGVIGRAIRTHLGDQYRFESLDLVEADDIPSHVADLADLDAILPAFDGKDAVVHLGGDASGGAPWESVLTNNIVGTHNVLEAARRSGLGRFIFASSNHTVGVNWEIDPYRSIYEGKLEKLRRPLPMLSTKDVRPCCLYGVGKAFGENLASFYHDRYGISCICIRIGGVSKEDEWHSHGTSGLPLYLSHRDAAQLVQKCIDAPSSVGHAVVYGISNNTLRFTEIDSAREILGYEPQDDAGGEVPPGFTADQISRGAHD